MYLYTEKFDLFILFVYLFHYINITRLYNYTNCIFLYKYKTKCYIYIKIYTIVTQLYTKRTICLHICSNTC